MAKKRRYKKSSKCPDPINAFLDIAGAATLGAYVKHKVKKDFENGCGEESAKAAAAVFGFGSMKRGSQGIINLGGLMGLNSALKDIEKRSASTYEQEYPPYVSPIEKTPAISHPVRAGIWRDQCEDGSAYGVYPEQFDSADDYEDALEEAKRRFAEEQTIDQNPIAERKETNAHRGNQYRWRLHCEDGAPYGLSPEDYETADDYAEALDEAKRKESE